MANKRPYIFLNFIVPPDMLKKLKALAKAEGRSVSDIVRRLLAEVLKNK
jgi:predicted CopG family antitoxin